MFTNNEYYRRWYDSITPKEATQYITELKVQGLWYPPDVCGTVQSKICTTIDNMVDISKTTGNETGCEVCRSLEKDEILTGPIIEGERDHVSIPLDECPKGYVNVGTLHTHPPYEKINGIPDHYPSPSDLQSGLYTGTHTNCIISEDSGDSQCYTLRVPKSLHDAYSISQEMMLDLEYHGKITPEVKSNIGTFINQFGCEFRCPNK